MSALYSQADRLHDLADALERRLDGDREAFGDEEVLALIGTAVHVRESLAAIDALTAARVVIPLDTYRTPRAEEHTP